MDLDDKEKDADNTEEVSEVEESEYLIRKKQTKL